MKANKLLTSIVAGAMLLSLAACNSNKFASGSDTTDSVSASSKAASKKSSTTKKQQVKTVSDDSSSSSSKSSSSATAANSSTSLSSASRGAAAATASNSSSSNGSSSSSSASTAALTQTQALDLLKERLGANLNNAGTSGQSMPVQPSATDVDSFTATQTGTNSWQFTGTVNGKTYTYNVSPTSITEN